MWANGFRGCTKLCIISYLRMIILKKDDAIAIILKCFIISHSCNKHLFSTYHGAFPLLCN